MKLASDFSGYGNAVLYKMCADKPKHTDLDAIASKIWIIGRAYSAAIERKAKDRFVKGKDFGRDIVAPQIRASKIDEWIESVSGIERLTAENLTMSLDCHKKVTDLFKQITGFDKRSLASKYLHFHAPRAFFIYDSIANRRVKQLLGDKQKRLFYAKEFDNEYSSFSARCIFYRDNILEKELGALVSPRRLDMSFLNYGI